jgi:hypothetical protein
VNDYWVKASQWAREHFRCDYYGGCVAPVRRIFVREGESQFGYCYPHYIEAKDEPSEPSSTETP